jgi:two-component system C4-dicarboxylate transport sensor histidine kinase DctB
MIKGRERKVVHTACNPLGLVKARGLVQSGWMKHGLRQRAVVVLAFLGIVLILAGGVWRYAYNQGLAQLTARGQADLALAGDRLVGQLQRYRDLAVMMADHPLVGVAVQQGGSDATVDLLLDVADKSAALDVMVLGRDGHVVASASGRAPLDLGRFALVKRALRGALGWGHGPANPLTKRAFFHAAPVFDQAGKVQGAVVVITDLNGIDYNWRGTNPAAFFTDAAGEVYISNRTELLFWRRPENSAGLIPPDGVAPRFSARMVGPHEIWQLGWGPYLPREALHLTQALPVIGMTGEVLLDVSQTRALALAQAAAVAALCLAFGSLLFLASERRRTLSAANVQLEARVAKRTVALRETNAKLLAEAAEREEAQAALRRAQDDLVQAGKLSALGQMSAGISHELNQPLMAIRSFAENAVQFLERDKPERAGENLTRISQMTQRMGRIIQNLRAFARQEDTAQDRVDLCGVLHSSLELTQSHREAADVTLIWEPPSHQVMVRGGEVRLGQVFVNLITNAVDAMAGGDERVLKVEVRTDDPITVQFRDTGPGIEIPDKVFDPFYSTKEVGQTGGMGLGLSISYGIVQSFGGQIKGSNRPEGGAVFTVTLEPALAEVAAA